MYDFQLLIKHILEHGVRWAASQEIVYRDILRYKYRDMYERVHRLANALKDLGIKKGDKVAVLDLSLIHISEPTRLGMISYAVFCLKKKK